MSEIEYDDNLNEAGWQMLELLGAKGPVSGAQFNGMRAMLKEVIEGYLNRRAEPVSCENPVKAENVLQEAYIRQGFSYKD